MKKTKPLKDFLKDAMDEDELKSYSKAAKYHDDWMKSKYNSNYRDMYKLVLIKHLHNAGTPLFSIGKPVAKTWKQNTDVKFHVLHGIFFVVPSSISPLLQRHSSSYALISCIPLAPYPSVSTSSALGTGTSLTLWWIWRVVESLALILGTTLAQQHRYTPTHNTTHAHNMHAHAYIYTYISSSLFSSSHFRN